MIHLAIALGIFIVAVGLAFFKSEASNDATRN
jgi:low temperature requirement protein LtrA